MTLRRYDEIEPLLELTLDAIDREFPVKPGHVYDVVDSIRRPRDLTPAFFGCAATGLDRRARIRRRIPSTMGRTPANIMGKTKYHPCLPALNIASQAIPNPTVKIIPEVREAPADLRRLWRLL